MSGGNGASPNVVLAGAILSLFGMVGAVLLLTLTGHADTTPPVLAVAAPLVAGLFVAAKVDNATASQNTQLDQHSAQLSQISHQTNGVLDQRIRDGVAAALQATGLVVPQGQPAPTVTTSGLEPSPGPSTP